MTFWYFWSVFFFTRRNIDTKLRDHLKNTIKSNPRKHFDRVLTSVTLNILNWRLLPATKKLKKRTIVTKVLMNERTNKREKNVWNQRYSTVGCRTKQIFNAKREKSGSSVTECDALETFSLFQTVQAQGFFDFFIASIVLWRFAYEKLEFCVNFNTSSEVASNSNYSNMKYTF